MPAILTPDIAAGGVGTDLAMPAGRVVGLAEEEDGEPSASSVR